MASATKWCERIDSAVYDLIVVNFANCDMVGHTGVLPAAVKAVEMWTCAWGEMLEAAARQNGVAIITADHGNCEQMIDPATGGPHTAHTTYDVECIVMDPRFRGKKLAEGRRLADLANRPANHGAPDSPGDDGELPS